MYTLSLYVSVYFSHWISLLNLIPGGPASGYSKQQLQAPLRMKTAPTPGSKSYLGQPLVIFAKLKVCFFVHLPFMTRFKPLGI